MKEMKAFTKWWNTPVAVKELKKEFETRLTGEDSSYDNIAKLAWKAGLEWALNEDDGIGCDPDKLEQELMGN